MRTPERRGGLRIPSGGPRVSGPGAASQRSDAAQPINVPNVGDSEDLRQGDRARLEAAQRQRPLARAPSPRLAAPRGGNSPAAAGGGGPGNLPPLDIPTTRPDEPETTGLPFGDGAGPEALQSYQEPSEKQQLIQWLASRPGASPEWQAVASSVADEQRPPEIAPESVLSLTDLDEEEPLEQEFVEMDEEADEELAPEELPSEQPNEEVVIE